MYKIYSIPINVSFPGLLRDAPRRDNEAILERYSNDIYSIYLNKLSEYMISATHDGNSAKRLRSLLEEIIKVKTLLHTEEIQKQDTIE
jgi:hypothetical protein